MKKIKKPTMNFVDYLTSTRAEIKKITWPTMEKTRKDTLIVLGACTFFALMYWGVNTGALALLKTILGKTL